LSRVLRKIQRVFDCNVTAIQSDNEKGYVTFLRDLCLDLGIRLELRAEHHEEQNGFTENAGKQLVEKSRSMRLQAKLPIHLTHELIRTAAYILNRTPLETNKWKTAYELVWGRQPNVTHLKPIGCRAYVLNRGLKRAQKLESRALIGHLVGYDSTNIYRIWLPQRDEVIRTRDVVFDTERFYEGPGGYASEAIVNEVIEVLAIPEPMVEDDIATDELLTRRQRRAPRKAITHTRSLSQR